MALLFGLFIAMALVLGIPASIAALIVVIVKSDNKNTTPQASTVPPPIPQGEPQVQDVQQEQFVQQVQYVPPVPKKPRKKMSASSVMMLIGTAFIILSAVTFVAANWVKMQPEGRVFTLAGAAVLAFTVSAVVKAAVKLEGTSIAFYTIGSVVSSVTLLTAAGYKLFGEWFSLKGDGFASVYIASFLILAVASFAAYFIYKKVPFNYFGFSFISLMLLFGCVQLTDNIEQFCPLIVLVQAVLTFSLHIIKPHKDTLMEKPAEMIGDITSIIFAIIGGFYVIGTSIDPTAYTFVILGVIMAQLALYGVFKKQTWMFIFFNILSVYTSFLISCKLDDKYSDAFAMLFFSLATLIIYIANLAFPKNYTVSKVLTLIAAIIGSIVAICANNDKYIFMNLITPMALSGIIAMYSLHKSKEIQVTAGIFAPFIPFFTAVSFNEKLAANVSISYNDITAFTYGGLVLIYLAVSAVLIFMPKFAFNFHAKHPMQTQTILYSNMVASAAVLMGISNYTPIFMGIVALCIIQFALSYMLRCNVTAIGSVVSIILLTSNILKHYFPDNNNVLMYSMFALFVVMVVISRFVFKENVFCKSENSFKIDVILLSSWITIFTYAGMGENSLFLIFISLAVFIAGFIKKNTEGDVAAVLLSFSSFLAALAALNRPFFTPDSSMLNNKITLAIFVLLGVAYKYIWKNHKTASKLVSTIIFVLSFAGLIVDGVVYSDVVNRIFVLVVTAGILILAFYTKSKTWFTASSIALCVITFFSTYQYFDKVGWWVYLFAVGVLLIAIAAINEALKKKGETMKSTVEKKFSDWTW